MSYNASVDRDIWLQHAWRNRLQSLFLLLVMAAFSIFLGKLLWGDQGVTLLLVVFAFGVLFHPVFSPNIIMRMYGAQPVASWQAPQLRQIVQVLSRRAGLEHPAELYYIPSSMLNAFAVGSPARSAIGITDGLLRKLDTRELAGVLAHEISHIRNNDLWVMGLADLFSRATSALSLLGQFLLLLNLPLILFAGITIEWSAIFLLILAPVLSALAQLALSRTREYDADLNAARLTEDPEGLAQALVKIEHAQGGWMEQIFMPGRRVPEPSLLRTHPPTGERVRRLMELKPEMPHTSFQLIDDLPSRSDDTFFQQVSRPPGWHISGLWH